MREFERKYPPQSVLVPQSSSASSTSRAQGSVVYGVHERTHLVNTNPAPLPSTPLFAQPPILPVATTPSYVPIFDTPAQEFAKTEDPPYEPELDTEDMMVPPAPKAATPRPLVQLASPSLVADPRVPPYLAFADVEVLHARLLTMQRIKDIGYLNWLTRAYAGGVRRRREATLNSLGGKLGPRGDNRPANEPTAE